VKVVAADALPSAEGVRANEAEPRSKGASIDDASAPGSLGGPHRGWVESSPCLTLPVDAAPGGSTLAPRSFGTVGLGAIELGLSGYHSTQPPPTN
jgi:hypothetical protein